MLQKCNAGIILTERENLSNSGENDNGHECDNDSLLLADYQLTVLGWKGS